MRFTVLPILLLASVLHAAECTCPDAAERGGWCEKCNVGYVAAVRIESKDLFEVLDAHGHDFEAERIRCESCQEAIRTEGFCDRCRMGFVENQAYLSRLTYHLARGSLTDPDLLRCPTCKSLAGTCGWCDACEWGWIGYTVTTSKSDFEHGSRAYEELQTAVKALSRCELCAIAMITHARCPTCKVSYKGGDLEEPTSRNAPKAEKAADDRKQGAAGDTNSDKESEGAENMTG